MNRGLFAFIGLLLWTGLALGQNCIEGDQLFDLLGKNPDDPIIKDNFNLKIPSIGHINGKHRECRIDIGFIEYLDCVSVVFIDKAGGWSVDKNENRTGNASILPAGISWRTTRRKILKTIRKHPDYEVFKGRNRTVIVAKYLGPKASQADNVQIKYRFKKKDLARVEIYCLCTKYWKKSRMK